MRESRQSDGIKPFVGLQHKNQRWAVCSLPQRPIASADDRSPISVGESTISGPAVWFAWAVCEKTDFGKNCRLRAR